MAGDTATPKLKRKRHDVQAQRKKAKVQNASSAVGQETAATPSTDLKTTPAKKVTAHGIVKTAGTPSQSQKKGKKHSKDGKSAVARSGSEAATPKTAHAPAASFLGDAPTGDVAEKLERKRLKAERLAEHREQRQQEREQKQKNGKQQPERRNRVVASGINGDAGVQGGTKAMSDDNLHDEQVDQKVPPDIRDPGDEKINNIKREQDDKKEFTANATPQTSVRTSRKGKQPKSKARSSASEPIGGWFLSQDPVFASDEKHLMLATSRSLQVYSTETSLLENTLQAGSANITAYALSSTTPNRVYVANTSGLITLWDWVESEKIGRWELGAHTRHMVVIQHPESRQDLVYCHESGTTHFLNVLALRTREHSSPTESKTILETNSPINGVQVLLEGKLVVVATSKSVLIGKRLKVQKTALQDFEYRWREFQTSQRITTSDAYVRLPDQLEKDKQRQQDPKDYIDLAIGDQEGVIYVFEDILSSLLTIEKSQKSGAEVETFADSLQPKRLHWHREAVGSLKWSRDGNYLISGGDETVMVIWQLSTGKQQFLPHLTAAIENLVLSPTGTSYAVSLANNSVVVLSTTELDAKTNILGVNSRRIEFAQMPLEADSSAYSYQRFSQIPMAVDPKNPMQVLYTAPSSQPRSQALHPPEPYMQTFDIAAQGAVRGQALTRNNATDLNMGPDGRKILEPNVEFLQFSEDGHWLATVDEWTPPRADFEYIDEGDLDFKEEERAHRRESHLKFWTRDVKNSQWVLESRINAPHFFTAVGAHARVLDLVSDPSRVGFATVGGDGFMRIWRPKTRGHDGVVLRGAKGDGVVSWSLEREIALSSSLDLLEPSHSEQASLDPRVARLAFSSDGSALAVGVSWASEVDDGVIHIIDAATGHIRRSITELNVTTLSCLGILGRHLIVVGHSIIVWDLVMDEIVQCTSLISPGIDVWDRIPLLRLAINETDRTFAIAHPQFQTQQNTPSTKTRPFKKGSMVVHVYDPYQPEVLCTHKIPDIVLALAAVKVGKGYIALDSSSSIRVLNSQNAPLQLPTPPPESTLALKAEKDERDEIENDDEQGDNALSGTLAVLPDDEALFGASENDKPVVRPEQLQHIFDSGPSHALPPVKDMFNAVVDLYARKPKVVPA
ncbi:WD40 repeat-like protein [Lophiostoma macrostomum CBS 122681]|uniref:WD40 repeat-like protein n=1 Tax=Lophiostoma macrostomum CBS 122681 TaxID=1314788 RepID=A0A6A6TKF4_9PLEO|nr:WD40 repeat-like protein [Lophiostoma macrostomum CBS 122681]